MRKSMFQLVFALLVIGFGVLLLLHNLNLVDLELDVVWGYVYPSLFILLGLKGVIDSYLKSKRGYRNFGWFWGLSLALFGGLLILNQLGILAFSSFGMVWRLFWPLILVYIGLVTFFGGGKSQEHWHDQWHHWDGQWCHGCKGDEHGNKESRFSVGTMKRSQANWSAEPMDVWNAIGEYDLDFTRAFIPEKEVPIKISGWIGDVRILVPRDVEFSVNVKAVVGDVKVAGQTRDGFNPTLSFKTPGFDKAERKLQFTIDFRILDLRIDPV